MNLHINRGEGTVSDGAADSAGKGEARVEGETAELLGLKASSLLGSVDSGSHCDVKRMDGRLMGKEKERGTNRTKGVGRVVETRCLAWIDFRRLSARIGLSALEPLFHVFGNIKKLDVSTDTARQSKCITEGSLL